MTQKHQEDQLKPTTDLLTTNRSDASPPSVATLWIGGSVLLWALYAVVIWVSYHPTSWLQSVVDALANVLPLTLLAFALRAILRGEVMARSPTVQAAWHVGLGITFATVWYGTVLILLAFSRGLLGDGFDVRAFAGPAFAWQVFQGLILYAAVAAICYAVQGGRDVAQVTIVTAYKTARTCAATLYIVIAQCHLTCATSPR